jgi:hypothetical protein
MVKTPLKFDYLNNALLVPKRSELQDITISENTTIASVQDGPEIITKCKNLTINSGCTYGLTNRCAGWTIIVNGNLTVNGVISANQLGIARTSFTEKVYGLYGYERNVHLDTRLPGLADNCINTLKSYAIPLHATQNGMGGVLKIYVKGNITIGAAGIISSDGASSCDGGVVRVTYGGTFVNSGTIRANAGSGGTAGTVYVWDLQYALTEYQKSLGTGEYIYTILDMGNNKILIGTRDTGHVWYTANGGVDWTDQGLLQSSCTVRDFLDLGGGVWLAATGENTANGAKLYKTINSGISWSLVTTLGTEKRICRLCNLGGGIILAGTHPTGKVYKSTDYGATFPTSVQLGSETLVRSFLNLGGGTVLAGTKGGKVYRSTDYGTSFTLLATIEASTKIRDMIDLGSGVLLAGTGTGKISKSINSGVNWTLKYTAPTNLEVVEFKRVKDTLNKVLVSLSPKKVSGTATQRHVAVTDNLGDTWRIITDHSSTTTNTYIKKMANIWYQGIIPHFLNVPINHFGAT